MLALGVARALGRRGTPVVGVFGGGPFASPYGQPLSSSRYFTRLVTFEKDLVDTLVELGPSLAPGAVLIPAGDTPMQAISLHRARLEPFYRLLMPPHERIEALLNKDRFIALAARHSLPAPVSFAVSSENDIRDALAGLRFPCLVKPPWRDVRWMEIHGSEKVAVAHDKAELETALRAVLAHCGHGVAQNLVPGPETNIRCGFTFLNADGIPQEIAVCRKIRQYPFHFGNTALAESVDDPEIEALTLDICRKLGLVGYVGIEFKQDQATGQWLVIEITPSRVNRQLGVTDLAGRSIAAAWYRTLTGQNAGPRPRLRAGVRWASEINDLRALRPALRSGEWSLARWIASYRRVRGFELMSWRDPRPFLMALASLPRFLRRRRP